MAPSLEQARSDVQSAFEAVRHWVDIDEPRALFETEQETWTRLLALGRALMALFLLRQASRPRAAEYTRDGLRFVVMPKARTSEVGTRFGKVAFTRPVGRLNGQRRGACDLPVDRELGLCGGFSLGVVLGLSRLCTQMAFAAARETFAQAYEWMPSPRAVLRMVDAVGEKARAFLEGVAAPVDDGEVLVVQVDGRGAPMINDTEYRRRRQPHRSDRLALDRHARRQRRRAWPKKKRRAKGDKSKNAKLAVVGVLYTLRRTAQGMEGPICKRVYGTFESHEALFIWLRREADKRGYGRKETIFLADGCEHIWRLQLKYFPQAEACIDWYHVVEKVWLAGECLHREGSSELRDWVAKQTARLRRDSAHLVLHELRTELAAIPRTGPGSKGKRKRLRLVIRYFESHLPRMNYGSLRRRDLDIGTGAAEGAVRNLIAVRLDGPGMRWGRLRAEHVLHLRCILVNGLWDQFVAHLAAAGDLTLAAQPQLARPHNAKARAAA
ncbi:MAG: hypothetical protein WC683_20035 [bacterium]